MKRTPKTPMMAIGNGELENNADIGETCLCPNCGKEHAVEYAERLNDDGTKSQSKLIAFVKCKDMSYIVALNGKKIR